MPEWLIERGIGETRAALVEAGEIIGARIELDGVTRAGTILRARLIAAGRNPVAADDRGEEYLLPCGAPGVAEGAALNIEVTRERIPGAEPWKRPLARVTDQLARPSPPLEGRELAPTSRSLDEAGWDDLIEHARSGLVAFSGGELRLSATPAMTLIDVDGFLDSAELAVRGAAEAGRAILRLDLGGSIGIDLPTSGSRSARLSAAMALDEVLPQPFERTAVNGFGFLQVVRPRSRASLLELAQDRAAFEARVLLRRAGFEAPGAKRLVVHPAVAAVLDEHPDWLEALGRQLGGAISLRVAAALPISSSYAESP